MYCMTEYSNIDMYCMVFRLCCIYYDCLLVFNCFLFPFTQWYESSGPICDWISSLCSGKVSIHLKGVKLLFPLSVSLSVSLSLSLSLSVSLSLSLSLSSICSEGMSRDLSGEVEKLLKSSNPYVVRKVSTIFHQK